MKSSIFRPSTVRETTRFDMVEIGGRTGASGLSDAELELLDVVAIFGGSRANFCGETFSNQYNRPFHGLNDAILKSTLDRFENEGWTTGTDYSSPWSEWDRSIEMTPAGG